MEPGYGEPYPHKRPLNVLGLNEVPRVDVDGGGRRKAGQRSAEETEKERPQWDRKKSRREGCPRSQTGGHFSKKGMMGSGCQTQLPRRIKVSLSPGHWVWQPKADS